MNIRNAGGEEHYVKVEGRFEGLRVANSLGWRSWPAYALLAVSLPSGLACFVTDTEGLRTIAESSRRPFNELNAYLGNLATTDTTAITFDSNPQTIDVRL